MRMWIHSATSSRHWELVFSISGELFTGLGMLNHQKTKAPERYPMAAGHRIESSNRIIPQSQLVRTAAISPTSWLFIICMIYYHSFESTRIGNVKDFSRFWIIPEIRRNPPWNPIHSTSHPFHIPHRSPPMDLCVGTLDVVQSCRMLSTLGIAFAPLFLNFGKGEVGIEIH